MDVDALAIVDVEFAKQELTSKLDIPNFEPSPIFHNRRVPRPVVLGNGRILVAYDSRYRIRELFHPQVGRQNHLSGNAIRLGIWVKGDFSWFDSEEWNLNLGYEPGSLALRAELANDRLGISIVTEETVSPEANILVRRLFLRTSSGAQGEVRLFSTQHLDIEESDIGNCAFFHPDLGGMVHYKGAHYFLFGGRTVQGGVAQYAAGIRNFGGLEGTWRDAEDGSLTMRPIAQGSVDSTIGLSLLLAPGSISEAQLWVVCASSLEELEMQFGLLREKGVAAIASESEDWWRAWVEPAKTKLSALPADVCDFAIRSLLILRTQIEASGAILAANDSDIMETNRANYSYVWPRDGALVAITLDRLGYHDEPGRFYRWCQPLITAKKPFFLQKYRTDGRFGASWHPWIGPDGFEVPFQEDETALFLHGLAEHYASRRDHDLLDYLYESAAVPAADFLISYRGESGLPKPSYDLWEERRGVHTLTACAVAAGLRGAAQLAMARGEDRTVAYAVAADEVLAAIRLHCVHPTSGALTRGHAVTSEGLVPDHTPDASLLLALHLGVFEPDDPIYGATVDVIDKALSIDSPVGGVARYPGDYYFRQSEAFPGNPWVICSLWLAQCKIALARTATELELALPLLRWAMGHAAPSGVLPEQLHPETGEHLSVSPLTWSHAEFLKTCLDYCEAVETA